MFLKILKRTTALSDTECLETYHRTGDAALLGALYERYMDMVFAVCYKYLRHQEEAEDAVMQIFEDLLTHLRTHEVTHFKTWLYSVARNHCLMQLRTQRVIAGDESIFEHPSHEPFAVELTSEDKLSLEEQLSDLGDCLQTLKTEQRRSIELFYLQQLCYQQIADQTGYELNKVKSYIQNGKRNLKICMESKQ